MTDTITKKKKEVHAKKLKELRNKIESLKNERRTPETQEEINQLKKQIKHEERKSHDTGETHHRR